MPDRAITGKILQQSGNRIIVTETAADRKMRSTDNMKYINELREGSRMSGIYLCRHRQAAVTKNGKPYENVILQDRTGTIDAKIWEPNSQGIDEFDVFDYVDIVGDVSSYNGALQVSIKRVRKAQEGEYNPADYLPTSRYDIEQMYQELLKYINAVKNPWASEASGESAGQRSADGETL